MVRRSVAGSSQKARLQAHVANGYEMFLLAIAIALLKTYAHALAGSCLHGPFTLLMTVTAVQDCNRPHGILMLQGPLWRASRWSPSNLPVGPTLHQETCRLSFC